MDPEVEWIFWDDGVAISAQEPVRRWVPLRDAGRSSLRPVDGTWSASWGARGPQREPGAGAAPVARAGALPSPSARALCETEFVHPEGELSDSDDESNGEEALAFYLAGLAGDEAERAAAAMPAPGSPGAVRESC